MNHLPRQRRRSRAALAWGGLAFLAGQLALAALLQGPWDGWRDPSYSPKADRYRERLAEAPPHSRSVVFLGSSRVAWGVRGERVERAFPPESPVVAFNFGVTGAGPLQQLLTLLRMLEDGLRPDVVVFEVLPPVFAARDEVREISRLAPDRFRLREHAFARRWGADPAQLGELAVASVLLPAHTHRTTLLQGVQPSLVPFRLREDWYWRVDPWGGMEPPPVIANEDNRAQALRLARDTYRGYFTDFNLGGSAPEALREAIALCQREGIRPVLLWMPEGPTFQSWYPPRAVGQVERFLAELQREQGVALIRARDWVREEQFGDSHHLLPAGAARFSDRLGPELVRLLNHDFLTNGQAGGPPGR